MTEGGGVTDARYVGGWGRGLKAKPWKGYGGGGVALSVCDHAVSLWA